MAEGELCKAFQVAAVLQAKVEVSFPTALCQMPRHEILTIIFTVWVHRGHSTGSGESGGGGPVRGKLVGGSPLVGEPTKVCHVTLGSWWWRQAGTHNNHFIHHFHHKYG